MVSQVLATPTGDHTPVFMLPVFDIFRDAFATVVPELPEHPSIAPVQRIHKREANQVREYEFKPFGVASFQIVHRSVEKGYTKKQSCR